MSVCCGLLKCMDVLGESCKSLFCVLCFLFCMLSGWFRWPLNVFIVWFFSIYLMQSLLESYVLVHALSLTVCTETIWTYICFTSFWSCIYIMWRLLYFLIVWFKCLVIVSGEKCSEISDQNQLVNKSYCWDWGASVLFWVKFKSSFLMI